jgi:hypothetical protein
MNNLEVSDYKACERTTFFIEKRLNSSLSIKEWFIMRYHMSICVVCKHYEKQSIWLEKAIRKSDGNHHYTRRNELLKTRILEKIEDSNS